jgi:Serine/Threonine/Tyrosine Kinase found in polyvalent proteins
MTYELRHILEGTGGATEANLIQTALLYLRESQTASGKIEKPEFVRKEDEVKHLIAFASQKRLWYFSIPQESYIGEGAEQKVYLNEDGKSVIKINDTIFYLSWQDYFISLLIHNFLFPNTAYQLLGFYQEEKILYSVVKQPFIESTDPTDLSLLRVFLEKNGFKHKKNNDYFHSELGIILEDLHDENVLTNQGVFFFIDSAIFLMGN